MAMTEVEKQHKMQNGHDSSSSVPHKPVFKGDYLEPLIKERPNEDTSADSEIESDELNKEITVEGGKPDNLEDVEDELQEKAIASSPDNRFLKFDDEVGRGAFKTVYKGLDTETGVAVAWCELQVSNKSLAQQSLWKQHGTYDIYICEYSKTSIVNISI